MPPEELETAVECAHILPGELPHWHRGKADPAEPAGAPLGEDFERALARAKGEKPGRDPDEPLDDAI